MATDITPSITVSLDVYGPDGNTISSMNDLKTGITYSFMYSITSNVDMVIDSYQIIDTDSSDILFEENNYNQQLTANQSHTIGKTRTFSSDSDIRVHNERLTVNTTIV